MQIDTCASLLRRHGHAMPFNALPIGATFECNGNVWTKHTTRTAVGIWPACLPSWAYFGAVEIVHANP